MIKNIFLAVLCLAIAFVGYKVFDLYQARQTLADVSEEYRTGPQDATLDVVEFLDYGCGYCREVHPTITEAVRRDGNVTYIPRPVAFLGPKSAYAAVVVYAAAKQGKFFEMHELLIRDFETLDEQTMPEFSVRAGVNPVAMKNAMASGDLHGKVLENLDLFEAMGTNATPTFIIGDKTTYVPEDSMPTVQDFMNMFAEARGAQQ